MIRTVWVEVQEYSGRAIQIFKSLGAAVRSHKIIKSMTKAAAVYDIRDQIWTRQHGECANCGGYITFATMHLHEKKMRSQGGTYSLENDEGLCADCHLRIMHPEKQLNFGKRVK